MGKAQVRVSDMNEPRRNQQYRREAYKPFGCRPADEAEGHQPAPKEEDGRDQQADDPEGSEQKVGEPGAHGSAHISVGFARIGDLCRVGRVVGQESKAAKDTCGEHHEPEQLKEGPQLGKQRLVPAWQAMSSSLTQGSPRARLNGVTAPRSCPDVPGCSLPACQPAPTSPAKVS